MIDICSKGEYPSNRLSNFAENHFVIDRIKCLSIEGFLQGLKYRNLDKQRKVCSLVGVDAKKKLWRIKNVSG